jgi:hypothetical protein
MAMAACQTCLAFAPNDGTMAEVLSMGACAGFGAMARHLGRLTEGVSQALDTGQLGRGSLALLQPASPAISMTAAMQARPRSLCMHARMRLFELLVPGNSSAGVLACMHTCAFTNCLSRAPAQQEHTTQDGRGVDAPCSTRWGPEPTRCWRGQTSTRTSSTTTWAPPLASCSATARPCTGPSCRWPHPARSMHACVRSACQLHVPDARQIVVGICISGQS